MRKRTLKVRLMGMMGGFNLFIVIASIVASFTVTKVCGAVQEVKVRETKQENLLYAVTRVADAFEWYNERRF